MSKKSPYPRGRRDVRHEVQVAIQIEQAVSMRKLSVLGVGSRENGCTDLCSLRTAARHNNYIPWASRSISIYVSK